jgi:hypothetical protein
VSKSFVILNFIFIYVVFHGKNSNNRYLSFVVAV